MDNVSKEVRSRIMAGIRSRGNATTELTLGELLWAAGLRGYRKHWRVQGKPDFAWPGQKLRCSWTVASGMAAVANACRTPTGHSGGTKSKPINAAIFAWRGR